ncbi:transcriptional regulator [Streptomyces sp. NPDC090798]|uniref:transcriptional regulator n=1 Tax=Streptomyces sp. NPDC090798 TaxID=3365968 RepID=UPI00381B417B
MRLVDGAHRLRAALLRGNDTIAVEFFDGAESDIFLHAVRVNVRHGLPLSLRERKGAAGRLLRTHPHLSDRALARVAGLSPKTVGSIRAGSAEGNAQPNRRVGFDGHVRPADSGRRREIVAAVLEEHPDASVREVAKLAGVAVSTAYEAKRRLREEAVGTLASASPGRTATGDTIKSDIKVLMADPSLRFTESGRSLLRLLIARSVSAEDLEHFVGTVPPHCSQTMAEIAQRVARNWEIFARQVQERARLHDMD